MRCIADLEVAEWNSFQIDKRECRVYLLVQFLELLFEFEEQPWLYVNDLALYLSHNFKTTAPLVAFVECKNGVLTVASQRSEFFEERIKLKTW